MRDLLWSADALAALFPESPLAADVFGISIDSRTTQPGDLFVALSGDPGPRFGGGDIADARDGHAFIPQAVSAGAAAVMAHQPVDTAVPVLLVPDTLDGLWRLGAAARDRTGAECIAITGSSGKTTLRYWLETVLAHFEKTHASTGSFNNHWGVPLSLSRMPADSRYGIFEVGTNHPGEISPLSELVRPDIAVLLNVLPAHIGNFPDMAALQEEKLSIAAGLQPGGTLVLPASLAARTSWDKIVSFGFEKGCNIRGQLEGGALDVFIEGASVRCQPPFADPGRCASVLAVFAVCHCLGLDLRIVAEQVSALDLPTGRGNALHAAGITIINDSYNANPVSMQMAIEDLSHRSGKRRIALLGEMRELGEAGPAAHAEVLAAAGQLDQVITVGEGFRTAALARGLPNLESVTSIDLDGFAAGLSRGDVVLVKGANLVFWKHGFVEKLVAKLS